MSIQLPLFISCKECRIESPRSFYGCFYIGPFKASQSLTVANALRRTLLSELSGLAITSLYIEGVSHEYTHMPGVRDSILDIVLNLKEIVLKSKVSINKPLLGYLQARGPGIVRACDLKLPAIVQCIDPNQYIATLAQDGKLSLKFTICEGKNFLIQTPKRLQQENFLYKAVANKVPICIDPIFTPINKVNYTIESDQLYYSSSKNIFPIPTLLNPVNPSLDSNNVISIELWTNGSIHPREAILKGFTHLICLFSNLGKMNLIQTTLTNSVIKSNSNLAKILEKIALL